MTVWVGGTPMIELWDWVYRADREDMILLFLGFMWITMMLAPGRRGLWHWSSGAAIMVTAVFINMY